MFALSPNAVLAVNSYVNAISTKKLFIIFAVMIPFISS